MAKSEWLKGKGEETTESAETKQEKQSLSLSFVTVGAFYFTAAGAGRRLFNAASTSYGQGFVNVRT